MGLDIRVYQNIKEVSEEIAEVEGFCTKYQCEDHYPQLGSLKQDSFYSGDVVMSFRAGSYSGYNAWRNKLAHFAWYGPVDGRYDSGAWSVGSGLFHYLINFSDCEGVIGPEICEQLYKEFSENIERAREWEPVGISEDRWIGLYCDFMDAFRLASNGGTVEFC